MLKYIFCNKPVEEWETQISILFEMKVVNIFSTRPSTIKKLLKVLGEPDKVDYLDGLVYSMEWNLSFSSRLLIRKVLTLSTLVSDR